MKLGYREHAPLVKDIFAICDEQLFSKILDVCESVFFDIHCSGVGIQKKIVHFVTTF